MVYFDGLRFFKDDAKGFLSGWNMKIFLNCL